MQAEETGKGTNNFNAQVNEPSPHGKKYD